MKTKNTKSTGTKSNVLPLGFQPIQAACGLFAAKRLELAGAIHAMERTIARVTSEYMPSIRAQATAVAENRIQLVTLIDANRDLFTSPKTRTFSDIKVGLRKQPGRIGIPDEAKTIALIQKHCPEQLDSLAPVKRTVSKEALEKLPADLLKKLSVEVVADKEEVLIKPQDSDVEKAVAALVAETHQPQLKAAA